MKKLNIKLLMFLFLTICFSCLAISKEELYSLLSTVDTEKSSQHTFDAAMTNLNALEEILLMPSGNPTGRMNAIFILNYATHRGLFEKSRFFEILLKQADGINNYTDPLNASIQLGLIESIISYYSYIPDSGVDITVESNFETLFTMISSFQKVGFFRNNGIQRSFEAKGKNALNSFLKGKPKTAVNQLTAFIHEISAQNGKGIKKFGGDILLGYIENLISHIHGE